jgi:hypothetical protein
MLPTIENPVEFLRDNGILFEMNRQVLHPLGLELRFELDENGKITEINLFDNREVAQPLGFTPEAFNEGREKYEAYLNECGRQNMQKRRRMGMLIQTGPNLGFHPGEVEE